jgi:anti-sigma B factor antagonist
MLSLHAKNVGTVAVLSLEGQIVTGETQALRSAVQSLPEVRVIKLDLAQVTMIDAAGLGAMLELREQTEARGIRLELINVSRQIWRVLEITRLNTVFRVTAAVDFFGAGCPSKRVSTPWLASCA